MTDQMFVFLCRDVRKYAFEYRRGELEAAETRKLEDHVAQCEACRDYLSRIEGMLDGAATLEQPPIDRDALFGRIVEQARAEGVPAASGSSLDRDRLFDRITAEIDVADTHPPVAAEVLQLEEHRATEETDRSEPGRPVALYIVAALAAGILIGISMPFLYPPTPSAPAPIADKSNSPADTVAAPTIESVELATLTPQPTPAAIDDVRVFGDENASWDIRTQGTRRKLALQEGTVLVEFVPRQNHELEFVADRFTVRVTGTIFYASARQGVVGVVTGSVEVDTADGETVKLVDGQEWVDGEGLRQAPVSVRTDAELHVDVTQHQLALAEARNAPEEERVATPPKREAPRPPMSKEVGQTPREKLRESAKQALKNARYDVAAQYYERMVEELSAVDPENASLRLDLARIYIRHLGQQRRAMVHLRRFVEDRPRDPLAPTAKTELCRIVSESGEIDPLCDL